jgi:uncharacterized protein YhjY with autotransporter beta-barrel domain
MKKTFLKAIGLSMAGMVCALTFFVGQAPAQTAYVTSSDGDWGDSATWGGGGFPDESTSDTASLLHEVAVETDHSAAGTDFAADVTLTINDGFTLTSPVTTSVDGTGTIELLGSGGIIGAIGAPGQGILAVIAGADSSASSFTDDVYAQSLEVAGTGIVTLDGDLNGDVYFSGDGVLEAGGDVNGDVAAATDGTGTLVLTGTASTVTGDVGTATESLLAVEGGSDGTVSTLSGDVHAGTVDVTGTGMVAVGGNLNGDGYFSGDGILEVGGNVSGDVATATNGTGILTMAGAAGTVAGDVGTATEGLLAVDAGLAATSTVFSGDVYAQTLNFIENGIIALGGDFSGDVTTLTDGEGILALTGGASTVAGDVGTASEWLFAVAGGGNGTVSTFEGDVYADSLSFTGNGTIELGGDVSGDVTTSTDGTGTFVLGGDASTVAGDVGSATESLLAVEGGADDTVSTLSGDVYAQTVDVTGTGTVAVGGDLNGDGYFSGDGVLEAGGDVNGDVTTATDGTGTLVLGGDASTVAGDVGSATESLLAVEGGADDTVSTLSGDVYAQTVDVTGTGTVAVGGDLNGDGYFSGDGVLEVAGNVNGDVATATDGTGILALTGATSTVTGDVGSGTENLLAVEAGQAATVTVFNGDVYAQELAFVGDGTISLDGDFSGDVTTLTDGEGSLDLAGAASTVSGDVGTDSEWLYAVTGGGDGATSTFGGDVYADSLSFTGNGVIDLGGDFSGDVTTAVDGTGTLVLSGDASTVGGDVGTATEALLAVEGGADDTVSTIAGDVYAQTVDVTGTGTVAVGGDLNGDGYFSGDGVLEVSGDVNGDVATVTDGTGTLALTGATSTVTGDVGTATEALLAVEGGENGTVSTFSGDVYAGTVDVTGTGTVVLDNDLNNDGHFSGNGTLEVGGDIAGAVTTATNNTGTLTLTSSDALVAGQVGSATRRLLAVNTGYDGTSATFSSNVFTQALNVNETGDVTLEGNLTGNVRFLGDGLLLSTGNITGAVTTAADGEGTLTLSGVTAAVSGQVGTETKALFLISAGEDGTVTTFNQDVYAADLDVTGTGEVVFVRDFTGSVGISNDGLVTAGGDINGDVTTATDNTGTLTLTGDASTVTGQVGTDAEAFSLVNGGADDTVSTFEGDVYAETLGVAGTGTVSLGGDLTGDVLFFDDGRLEAGGDISGAVTTLTDGTGTLALTGASSILSGDAGTATEALLAVEGGSDGTASTFLGDVYAQTASVAGTGSLEIFGDLNGSAAFDGDGELTVGGDITGDVTTADDGTGALVLTGAASTVYGTVGSGSESLDSVYGGDDGQVTTFAQAVNALELDIGGSGSIVLESDLNGSAFFWGDGDLTANGSISGDVLTLADGTGTLSLLGASGSVEGDIGDETASLLLVNAGDTGVTTTFSGNVFTQSLNFIGDGVIELGNDFTGDVTTSTDGAGTLNLTGTDMTLTGQVGTDTEALLAVNAGYDNSAAVIIGDVYAGELNVAGEGSVEVDGTLNGPAVFSGDGTLIADGDITGDITAASDGIGTLTVAGTDSTVFGQVGTAAEALLAVNTAAEGTDHTFDSDVYAGTMVLNGTGTALLNGDLYGDVLFEDDGLLIAGGDINGDLTTGLDAYGTLYLTGGASTVTGQVGSGDAGLWEVYAGTDGTSSTFEEDIYAQYFNITGTGDAAVEGDLNSEVWFMGDGTLAVYGDISGDVVALDSGTGTLDLAGADTTVWGQVGSDTEELQAVNAGTGTWATFLSDVYAQVLNVNGTGDVVLNGNLVGDLYFNDDGYVTLADAKNISGSILNNTGADGAGTIIFEGDHATTDDIGIGVNRQLRGIGVYEGTLTMGHDLAAQLVYVDEGGVLALSGDHEIAKGDLELGGALGGGELSLGLDTLTMTEGGLTTASGSAISLTAASASSYGRLLQTAVDASIAAGTTINVDVTGYIRNNSVLKIVDGAGGSGVAGGLTVTDTSVLVSFTPNTAAGSDLTLTASVNYDPQDAGGGIGAVARALAQIDAQGPSEDMQTVLEALQALPSAEKATDAIARMRPLEGPAIAQQSMGLSSGGVEAVSSHLAAVRDKQPMRSVNKMDVINSALDKYEAAMDEYEAVQSGFSSGESLLGKGMWGKIYGSQARQNDHKDVAGYRSWGTGLVVGVDIARFDTAVIGLAAGYAYSVVNAQQIGVQPTYIRHFPLMVYTEFDPGEPWRVNASVSAALNTYAKKRAINFGTISRIATADYTGQQYTVHVAGTYDFALDPVLITPSIFMDYNHLSLPRYTESGAGALNLSVDAETYDQLSPGIGLALSATWDIEKILVTPQIYGRWSYDLINDPIQTRAAFNGTGVYFETPAFIPSRQTVDAGLACGIQLQKDVTVEMNYDTSIKQDYVSNNVSAMFKRKF